MGGGVEADNVAPALQVIVLGSGGGPLESNTTAFLVRSVASGWRKGSVVAVDAGVHLSAISRILEDTQPPDLGRAADEELKLPHTLTSGPFAGLEVPHASASANAAHVHRTLIDTYLITHPHLDHIAGFVINTAGLPGSRPKRLAGLPSTIAAFKTHIFNNVIWPNLSDENNGAGLVTYMRLVEGGSPAFGDGEGKGYLEVSDGLAVKIWGVSHGHCIERHSHRGSGSSNPRFGSMDASMGVGPIAMGMGSSMALASPRGLVHHNAASPNLNAYLHQQQRDQLNSPQLQQQQQQQQQGVVPGSTAASGGGRTSSVSGGVLPTGESVCVYDSSAYFIRDMTTGREVLIFGDVEPDSISLSPRNLVLWQEAAPKIAAGNLTAIFIECSYDDSQSVDRLFGHLAPRFIIEELVALAAEVGAARMLLRHQRGRDSTASQDKSGTDAEKKKRKREGDDGAGGSVHTRKAAGQTSKRATSGLTAVTSAAAPPSQTDDPVSPKTVKPGRGPVPRAEDESPHVSTPTAELSLADVELPAPVTPLRVSASSASVPEPRPLKGLKVVIIHMKDKLNDGPHMGDIILGELAEYEKEAQLGCEFVISSSGQSLYL